MVTSALFLPSCESLAFSYAGSGIIKKFAFKGRMDVTEPEQRLLLDIYKQLFSHFGPQGWWPARSPLEVVVGAMLVQNTSWGNVEKAIAGLRRARLLKWAVLSQLTVDELAPHIRACGYYRLKGQRLLNLLEFLKKYRPWHSFFNKELPTARTLLLGVNGVGPETADALLLYVGKKATFVADVYSLRILIRHGWLAPNSGYEQVRAFFMDNLPSDPVLFAEYHALLMALAKNYCRKNRPLCVQCPLYAWLAVHGNLAHHAQ